jgi:hypothetical protein
VTGKGPALALDPLEQHVHAVNQHGGASIA